MRENYSYSWKNDLGGQAVLWTSLGQCGHWVSSEIEIFESKSQFAYDYENFNEFAHLMVMKQSNCNQ